MADQTINGTKFRELTLDSADEDGKVTPPSYGDWWEQQSILIGMYMEGLIEKRGPEKRMYDRGGPWYITSHAAAIRASSKGGA